MVLGILVSNIMSEKNYCITGKVTLEFTQEITLTEEEYKQIEDCSNYFYGSKGFDILFNNIDATDYECSVDEYDLMDIEEIND